MLGFSSRTALAVIIGSLLAGCSTTAPPGGTASPTVTASTTVTPTALPSEGYALGGDDWYATASKLDDQVGTRFLFDCPPDGFTGFGWGTDIYTSSSWVCSAAVHAGLITFASGGPVVIEIRPGQDSYVGSVRNGVTTSDYASWDGSFVFVSPATSPAPSASPTLTLPPATGGDLSGELIAPGTLQDLFTPFGRPRFAELDAEGRPFGVNVEIGQALAEELALAPEVIDTLFEDLIPAVIGDQCDVSIGGQFITAGRLEQIAMIPYRQGAPHVVVAEGNPLAIEEFLDLCGRRFAVVTATVYVDMVQGVGDFAGAGIDEQCADSALPPVQLQEYLSQGEAEDALAGGDADAYAGNDYVTVERPAEFDLSFELPPLRNGIGLRLGATDLDAALRAALRALIADGRYLDILEKYGAQDNRVTETP